MLSAEVSTKVPYQSVEWSLKRTSMSQILFFKIFYRFQEKIVLVDSSCSAFFLVILREIKRVNQEFCHVWWDLILIFSRPLASYNLFILHFYCQPELFSFSLAHWKRLLEVLPVQFFTFKQHVQDSVIFSLPSSLFRLSTLFIPCWMPYL